MRAFAETVLGPALGQVLSASSPALHPEQDLLAVTAEVRDSLEGRGAAHVALLGDGGVELLRAGHSPCWSPDGTRLAHLVEDGVQLDAARLALGGVPERLSWCPDGSTLLVVVAEPGSEVGNLAGSGVLPREDAWTPHVSSPAQHLAWRRLVVVDVSRLRCATVSRADLNVWDACWAGPTTVVAVCSDGSPAESAWYRADLRRIDVASGDDTVLAAPAGQLGVLAGSPSGRHVAYVEAVCSDRDLSAGALHLVDLVSGQTRSQPVPGDVTDLEFVDDQLLGFASVRGLATVLGTCTLTGAVEVLWESEDESTPGAQPQASFRPGRTGFLRCGHLTPPEASLLTAGKLTTLAPLAAPGSALAPWRTQVRRWTAPDGLEIEGWLHLPAAPGPHPLVVLVHGGPVSSHRSAWSRGNLALGYLLSQGYAVLLPNPRGSSGRGEAFAAAVVGDMAGADAQDVESGVEALVAAGIADPARIGVMGGSYGGYLAAWFAATSPLFRAAVSMYPVTDWAFQHGSSNIPLWDELFLDGRPEALDGQYRGRSPLAHAGRARTPTLFLAGGLDRACPAGQALAMHRALVAHGVPSECVVYPCEGHGARDLSAAVDVTARVADWFGHWLTPDGP